MTAHLKYMARCLTLARNGLGSTYPNPMVGSVIVHEDKIIGEGWHHSAGAPHAEVNAIRSVSDPALLKAATIYVNLEPCSHFGKTPPCADLIIEKEIKNVVIGTTDPNPKVAGRGIQKLKEAGCTVISGVLEEESRILNKRFFKFHEEKRPYIFLKWAQSKDGFLAPVARDTTGPVWITTAHSRQWVHKMRSEEQSILVGTQTVIDDDPSLTARKWDGLSPTRIVLDRQLRIPTDAMVYDQSVPTIFITEKDLENRNHINFETIDFSRDVAQQICDVLYRYKLQSVIVEGGARMLQTFLEANLWDEAWVFTGEKTFANGLEAPQLRTESTSEVIIGTDTLHHYKNPDS